MPPKNKKEEEAARLAEEERRRQIEEQLIREENHKYGCTTYKTDMLLPITQYIIDELKVTDNQSGLLREYLYKILERCNCSRPRDIDVEIAVEQLVNDFQTCQEFGLKGDAELLFINMMFLVYVNQHEKFGKLIDSKGTKSLINDRKLFYRLVAQHSTDGQNCHKVFVAKQLQPIIGYMEKGYLSHWLLLMQAHSFNQRPLEIQVDLQIELPLPQPQLDDNMYYKPIVVEEEQSIKRTEAEEQEEQYHEPTDEELLDSVILKAIEQKIITTQEELNEKLKERHEVIELKLQEMAAASNKKKK